MRTNMVYYAIQEISTGFYMPQGITMGNTSQQPTGRKPPRLFTTKRGATQALNWWLKGCFYNTSKFSLGNTMKRINPYQLRSKNNMRVVMMTLTCNTPSCPTTQLSLNELP